MIGKAPRSMTTGVPGWETPSEEQVLIEVTKKLGDDATIVELGGEYGRSASQFAKASAPTATVYTVDLFPDDYQNTNMSLLQIHRSNLQEAGVLDKCKQVQGDSVEVGQDWDTPIDFLFVDANHTYETVKQEIQTWLPHVKRFVAFHDYAGSANTLPHESHYEVARAVNEFFDDHPNWRKYKEVDSLIVFEFVKLSTETSDYSKLKKDELKELCKERGIFVGNSTKSTLVEKLEAYDEEN